MPHNPLLAYPLSQIDPAATFSRDEAAMRVPHLRAALYQLKNAGHERLCEPSGAGTLAAALSPAPRLHAAVHAAVFKSDAPWAPRVCLLAPTARVFAPQLADALREEERVQCIPIAGDARGCVAFPHWPIVPPKRVLVHFDAQRVGVGGARQPDARARNADALVVQARLLQRAAVRVARRRGRRRAREAVRRLVGRHDAGDAQARARQAGRAATDAHGRGGRLLAAARARARRGERVRARRLDAAARVRLDRRAARGRAAQARRRARQAAPLLVRVRVRAVEAQAGARTHAHRALGRLGGRAGARHVRPAARPAHQAVPAARRGDAQRAAARRRLLPRHGGRAAVLAPDADQATADRRAAPGGHAPARSQRAARAGAHRLVPALRRRRQPAARQAAAGRDPRGVRARVRQRAPQARRGDAASAPRATTCSRTS